MILLCVMAKRLLRKRRRASVVLIVVLPTLSVTPSFVIPRKKFYGGRTMGWLCLELCFYNLLGRHVDFVVHDDHDQQRYIKSSQSRVQLVNDVLRDNTGGTVITAMLVTKQQ